MRTVDFPSLLLCKHLFLFLHLQLLFLFVRKQTSNFSALCYWTARSLQKHRKKLSPIFSFLASFRHKADKKVMCHDLLSSELYGKKYGSTFFPQLGHNNYTKTAVFPTSKKYLVSYF